MPYRTACLARWVPLVAFLAMGPGAGAARSAPSQSGSTPTAAAPAIAELPLAEPDVTVRTLVVRPGDTLGKLLATARIASADAAPALAALTSLFPAHTLQPGQELTLRQDPAQNNALIGLRIETRPGHVVTVSRSGSGWTAKEMQAEQHRHLVLARGQISGALFDNLQAAGLPPSLALGLVRVLAHEIDFQRDLQPGDSFAVLFERFRDADGQFLRNGEVVHAEFQLSDRRLSIWRHVTAEGADWYDDTGRSLRHTFLRTPLDGAHATSGFGMRHHPVLGFTRMHQGVDFAAPAGTPVYAAADGVVERIGHASGYGRMIVLRHAGGTETRYAHLSAFARGLKPGSRVRQGDVIGKVGSSGLATGPHLHYEILMAGRPVDPATAQAEAGTQLTGRDLAAFMAERRSLQAWLARLEPMQEVAAAD